MMGRGGETAGATRLMKQSPVKELAFAASALGPVLAAPSVLTARSALSPRSPLIALSAVLLSGTLSTHKFRYPSNRELQRRIRLLQASIAPEPQMLAGAGSPATQASMTRDHELLAGSA